MKEYDIENSFDEQSENDLSQSIKDDKKYNVEGTFLREGLLNYVTPVFSLPGFFPGEKEKQDLTDVSTMAIATIGSNMRPNQVVKPEELNGYSGEILKVYEALSEKTNQDPDSESSYRKRIMRSYMDVFKMLGNGGIKTLQEEGNGLYGSFITSFQEFSVDLPTPNFVKERNEKNAVISSKYDAERFEQMMKETKFADYFIEEVEYTSNYLLPYLKAKKEGNVYPDDEREFKKNTYDHLLRQKENISTIREVEFEDVKDMYPFSTASGKQQLNNWKGVRFGEYVEKILDDQISAVEHGLAPEDLTVVADLYHVRKAINSDNVGIVARDLQKYNQAIDKFSTTHVTNAEERKKLYDDLAPVYKAYSRIHDVNPDYAKHYNVSRKQKVDMTSVNPDERDRQDMINNMEKFIKGLSTQHRKSLINHTDTEEMRNLKNKAKETLQHLKEYKGRSIFEDTVLQNDFKDLETLSKTYADKKKSDAVEKIKNKGYDAAKEQRLINEWKPETRMGRIRLATAKNMYNVCGNYFRKIRKVRVNRADQAEDIERVKEAGIRIINKSDFEYTVDKPYETGVKQIINYFGKNPAFVPEHALEANQMYKAEDFINKVKPINIGNVSNENFALAAFAAVLDKNNLNLDPFTKRNPVASTTNEDTYYQSRTMFTFDMALNEPRAGIIAGFYDGMIGPARNKAFEAFEAYNKGDKSKLIDVMATGMKELQDEITLVSYMSEKGNYAYGVEMLSKMVKFVNSDDELKKGVTRKLGVENQKAINDTLRLKYYMDESISAKKLLKVAHDNKNPLSLEEKKECIEKIVRFKFIKTMHDKERNEVEENNKELMDFRLSDDFLKSGVGNDKVTNQDILNKEYNMIRNIVTPVASINRRLRTQDGLNRLKNTVANLSAGIDPNQSEEKILKAVEQLENQSYKDMPKKG